MIQQIPPRTHLGVFTRDEYPDAMKNGTRVMKIVVEDGDAHPVGALATVLGSIGHPEVGIGYFVEWDDLPAVAVFVRAAKITALPPES